VSCEKDKLKHNKECLYEIHGYDPREGTKNVHHIVFKSDGGTNDFENLALLDIQTHAFIHKLIDNIHVCQKKK
jgi:hypothetical protein